jgi:hypothetical protein
MNIICHLTGGDMPSFSQSEFAENAKPINMNKVLAAQLNSMGRQMNALVTAIKGRIHGEAVKTNEDDRVSGAGS